MEQRSRQASPVAAVAEPARGLTRPLLAVMALSTAMIAANRYYCQPLLADMARSLRLSPAAIGVVPTLTQAGIAIGLVLFVPLADALERRQFIACLLLVCAGALALTASAFQPWQLFAAALLIGLFACVSQAVVGLAAFLASPAQRGQVVGTVTGGLLIGVLSARTVGGLVGGAFGWRTMYVVAALGMVALAVLLRVMLPLSPPTHSLAYPHLLKSLLALARTQPELREAALLGGLAFGATNAFWTTLVFFIGGAPYHYGTKTAGLFGLVGVAGALAAPVVGVIADRRSPRAADGVALLIGLFSFGVLWAGGRHLAGLIAGMILLDLAAEANMVLNQTRIYSLLPEAANRMNTIYMSSYFVGGSIGTAVGSLAWDRFGWAGVCGVGALLFAAALGVYCRPMLRSGDRVP